MQWYGSTKWTLHGRTLPNGQGRSHKPFQKGLIGFGVWRYAIITICTIMRLKACDFFFHKDSIYWKRGASQNWIWPSNPLLMLTVDACLLLVFLFFFHYIFTGGVHPEVFLHLLFLHQRWKSYIHFFHSHTAPWCSVLRQRLLRLGFRSASCPHVCGCL